MQGIGITEMVYHLDYSLEVDFLYDNIHIVTISHSDYLKRYPKEKLPRKIHGIILPKQKTKQKSETYLIIRASYELEIFDSHSQGNLSLRPRLLVVLGILSFLTGKIFTPFQSSEMHSQQARNHVSHKFKSSESLIVEGADHSDDMKALLKKIDGVDQDQKILIYTLFERWRKAIYMEQDEEEVLFLDEAVLAYFHIIELLSDDYKEKVVKSKRAERDDIIKEIIALSTSDPKNLPTRKIKALIKSAGAEVTVKEKIVEMLKALGMDSPKSRSLLTRYIQYRNDIAHGRRNIYIDKLVFPLPQFFSLIKDINEDAGAIRILSARSIAAYLGLERWEDEWNEVLDFELVPWTEVSDFITSEKYKTISPKVFLTWTPDEVTAHTIGMYYVQDKIKIDQLEIITGPFILSTKISESSFHMLFVSLVSLADSKSIKLADKCRAFLIEAHDKRWNKVNNFRDTLKEFKYYGKELIWLHSALSDRLVH